MANKFYLIDGHAQIFQAYYAIPQLLTPAGEPVNAVYGFTSMLRKLLKNKKPYYVAITFDTKGPTFRHEQFADYKATRKPMPEDLRPQIPLIERVVKAFNIPTYSLKGFEADDVIGTIVKILSKKGIETLVITKDKDIEQLIDDNIKILDFKKDEVLDLEGFREKRGVNDPLQMIDVLAMVGDTADNIPGVPGVGYKTAVKLIKEWHSLEDILANADNLSGKKLKENIKQFADQARMSKELVTINTEVPINFELEDCCVNGINETEINVLFEEFGFKSFLSKKS